MVRPFRTKILICTLDGEFLIGIGGRRRMIRVSTGCNRLFPSKERIMAHRKRDHSSEEEGEIVSWNL